MNFMENNVAYTNEYIYIYIYPEGRERKQLKLVAFCLSTLYLTSHVLTSSSHEFTSLQGNSEVRV